MSTIDKASYSDLEEATDRLAAIQSEYLRRFGWKYTSQTPGSYWLWQREIDGVTYCMDDDAAIRMTRCRLDTDSEEPTP